MSRRHDKVAPYDRVRASIVTALHELSNKLESVQTTNSVLRGRRCHKSPQGADVVPTEQYVDIRLSLVMGAPASKRARLQEQSPRASLVHIARCIENRPDQARSGMRSERRAVAPERRPSVTRTARNDCKSGSSASTCMESSMSQLFPSGRPQDTRILQSCASSSSLVAWISPRS